MSSNNMYNILNTLKSLEPTTEQTVKAEAKRIYESVAAQGSITAGVDIVEARLRQQFAESDFSDTSKAIQKSGKSKASADAITASIGRKKLGQAEMTRRSVAGKKHAHEGVAEGNHEGMYSPEAIKMGNHFIKEFNLTDDIDQQLAIEIVDNCLEGGLTDPMQIKKQVIKYLRQSGTNIQSRKQGVAEDTVHKGTYGTEYDPSDEEKKDKPKYVARQGVKGRKPAEKPAKANLPADPFGRTTGEVPKGKKGTKIKGKDNIDTVDEAAKWRNPEYKGKFYTQKKGDSDDYDSIDYGYGMPERPKKDPGQKRRMGGIGDEWEVTDKLSTGHMDIGNTTGGAHWAGTGGSTDMKDWKPSPYKDSNVTKRGPRKGFITKSGINTVKDRIKGALGQHHSPVLPESAEYQKQNFIVESFNFAEMMKETDQTVQEMLTELQSDIANFKMTGECSPKLDAFLRVHGHSKKQLADEAKAVPNYEVPAVQRKVAGEPPLNLGDVQTHDANRSMHPGMTKLDAPKPAIHDELDELAQLAGITDEGNAFTGKLAKTAHGDEFELDGKTFKDTSQLDEEMCNECGMYESQCGCTEGNLFTKKLAQTAKGGEFELDGKKYKDTSSLDEASMKLEDMAKLAGIAVEGRDYGDTTYPQAPAYDNTPNEEVQGEDVMLKGGDGEVAGAEKKMAKDGAARFSDNPLAMKESETTAADLMKEAATFDPIEAMGRKLMKAYEAIKVTKVAK
jgi:hypothetical protein